jgi:hypothetical protein
LDGKCTDVKPPHPPLHRNETFVGSFQVSLHHRYEPITFTLSEGGFQYNILASYHEQFVGVTYDSIGGDPGFSKYAPNEVSENPIGFVDPIDGDLLGRKLSCFGLVKKFQE